MDLAYLAGIIMVGGMAYEIYSLRAWNAGMFVFLGGTMLFVKAMLDVPPGRLPLGIAACFAGASLGACLLSLWLTGLFERPRPDRLRVFPMAACAVFFAIHLALKLPFVLGWWR
jgi:hypothetical protein